jgi:hypothetical protein
MRGGTAAAANVDASEDRRKGKYPCEIEGSGVVRAQAAPVDMAEGDD